MTIHRFVKGNTLARKSDGIARDAKSRKLELKACRICGIEKYIREEKIHCSKICQYEASKVQTRDKCRACQNQVKRKGKLFCSRKCYFTQWHGTYLLSKEQKIERHRRQAHDRYQRVKYTYEERVLRAKYRSVDYRAERLLRQVAQLHEEITT